MNDQLNTRDKWVKFIYLHLYTVHSNLPVISQLHNILLCFVTNMSTPTLICCLFSHVSHINKHNDALHIYTIIYSLIRDEVEKITL